MLRAKWKRPTLTARVVLFRSLTRFCRGLGAAAGGLIAYGASITEQYRLVGLHVGHILGGERPAELLVRQSIKVEPTINLKTAKSRGLPPASRSAVHGGNNLLHASVGSVRSDGTRNEIGATDVD